MSINRASTNRAHLRYATVRPIQERVTRFQSSVERSSRGRSFFIRSIGPALLALTAGCAGPSVIPNTPLLQAIGERHADLEAGNHEKIAKESAQATPPWLQLQDFTFDPKLATQVIEPKDWDTLWDNSPKLNFDYVNPENNETVRINYARFGNPKSPIKIYSCIGTPDCVLSQIPYMIEVAKQGGVDLVIADVTGGLSERNVGKIVPTVDRQAQANLALIQSLGFADNPSKIVLILSGFSNGPFKLGSVIASGKVPFDGFMMLAPWFPQVVADATQRTSDEWMMLHTPLLVRLFGKAPFLGVQAAVKGLVTSNEANEDQVDRFCSQWGRTFGEGMFVDGSALEEMRHELANVFWLYDRVGAFTSLMKGPVGRALQGKPVMIVSPTHDTVIRTANDTGTTTVQPVENWNGFVTAKGEPITVEGVDANGENHAMRIYRVLKQEFGVDVEIHFVNSNHLMFEAAPEVAEKILQFIEKMRKKHEAEHGPLQPLTLLWKQPTPAGAQMYPAMQFVA